jgi:hypothetical protein
VDSRRDIGHVNDVAHHGKLAADRPFWVIRVDIAMPALSSAIHNTRTYNVGPGAVCP